MLSGSSTRPALFIRPSRRMHTARGASSHRCHAGLLALASVCAIALTPLHGAAQASDLYQASYESEARTELATALAVFERIGGRDRDTYMFALRHGWLLYLNARYPESVQAYQLAQRRAPNAVEPWLGMLLPQLAMRQWRAAEQSANSALAIDPLNSLALRRLAFALFNLGRFADAEVVYKKAFALYPGDLEMLLGVAWCELRRGDPKAALRTFSEVLRFSPRNPSARDGKAAAQASLSK